MPIKRIQLRGISRTPSDRQSTDGGCAESLNVHLDQYETAPTMPALDVSSTIYPSGATQAPIIYVHKMPGGRENYIGFLAGQSYGTLIAYGKNASGQQVAITMGASIPAADSIVSLTSIGNTLVVFTDKNPYYFLFKDGAYVYLGSQIPKPAVEVATVNKTSYYTPDESIDPTPGDYYNDGYFMPSPIEYEELKTNSVYAWNAAINSASTIHSSLLGVQNTLWNTVSTIQALAGSQGYFVAPFFVRYALRLYDGSYIYTSAPILCGCMDPRDWVVAKLSQVDPYDFLGVYCNNAFKVYMKGSYTSGNWSDIVKSIDIFASTPIYAPNYNAEFESVDNSGNIIFAGMSSDQKADTTRAEVLSKGQFYKVDSIALDDTGRLSKLQAGTLEVDSSFWNGSLLAVQETMTDGYRDGAQYIPVCTSHNYNSRLLLVGAKEILSSGDLFLNGLGAVPGPKSYADTPYKYIFRYKIVDKSSGKEHYVLSRYIDGANWQKEAFFCEGRGGWHLAHGSSIPSSYQYRICNPYSWIAYPDTRCTQVEVYRFINGVGAVGVKIPMEPHPLLECSFAFFGMGVSLESVRTGGSYSAATSGGHEQENCVSELGNKIFLSEFENPYLFPAGNIITFQDKVIDVAAVTVPLSEGQAGDFNLYAFTEGGIRVMVTTGEGTISAVMPPPNVARHVAIPGTILSMEQAVIFITEKGVMMLSGGNVRELSAEMNGKPFVLSGAEGSEMEAINTSLASSSWSALLSSVTDDSTFMNFMRNARPAYDYNGSRIFFFDTRTDSSGKPWQYVYKMDTGTWHKFLPGIRVGTALTYPGIKGANVVNSFPECLISFTDVSTPSAPVHKVLNFSTALKDKDILSDTASPVKGIIVTRPFDLEEPDIRKALRSIRIRGRYNRNDVQYILLGSFDGINWHWMKSLRTGSYKMFRMVILTNLTATERITWVDVDYETRFTNRLR